VILRAQKGDLEKCLLVIRESFATVAEEFGLTEANCPGHTAFLTPERLERISASETPCIYTSGMAAPSALSRSGPGRRQLRDEASKRAPPFRHLGIGASWSNTPSAPRPCAEKARMTIGIMEESSVRRLVCSLGFVETARSALSTCPLPWLSGNAAAVTKNALSRPPPGGPQALARGTAMQCSF
jgi:hypothetical protein